MSENLNTEVLSTEEITTPVVEVDTVSKNNTVYPVENFKEIEGTTDGSVVEEVLETEISDENISTEEIKISISAISDKEAPIEDDGILGIPLFNEKDYELMDHILVLDTGSIKQNSMILRTVGEVLKGNTESINLLKNFQPIDSERKKLTEDCIAYIASRNILVEYRNAITEYVKFIDAHKEDILNKYSKSSDSFVTEYIESTSKQFGIEYKEGSLIFYMLAVALKRAALRAETEENSVVSLLRLNKLDDPGFETIVNKTLKPIMVMLSNIGRAKSFELMSPIERDTLRIISDSLKRMKKITTFNENDDVFKNLPTPKLSVLNLLYRLSSLLGKKFTSNFRAEKKKHLLENKRYKIRQERTKPNEKPRDLPFHDNFIKSRFSLLMIESSIKKFFSIALFGDRSILNNKEYFLSILGEMDKKFSKAELFAALLNTFFYEHVFNEFVEIIKYVPTAGEYRDNNDKMNIIKSYVMTIDYYSKSTNYIDYGFKELYSDYIIAVANSYNKLLSK